jgi:ABC-type cobalamin/Fe3+-siderophores transport system ATPase subunit
MNSDDQHSATLSVSHLSASYQRTPVLTDVSLRVRSGEVVCLSGPNGSGKSTLLSLMAGIAPEGLAVTSGGGSCALFCGTPLSSMNRKDTARRIAYMIQDEQTAWNYTARDIILTGRYAHTAAGNYSHSDYETAERIIAETGIEALAGRRIFSLSGGEMQKVRIARALAQEPDILLLDEPAANLDFSYQSELLSLIRHLAHDCGLGVLVTIHDLNTASRFADTIALLPKNRQILSGTPKEVFTAQHLSDTYGVPFGIFTHPSYGCPQAYAK